MTRHSRFLGLDILRSIAITIVVISHYPSNSHAVWYTNIRQYGWSGVELFFVLSGYLIAAQIFRGILTGKDFSFGEFYLKRALRILPSYLVVVAIYFTFPIIREADTISPLWKYLTFTQNFGLNFNKYGAFSHAWSLCVEEHFYLCLPLLLLFFRKLQRPALKIMGFYAILIAFGLVSRWEGWKYYLSGLPTLTHSQAEARYFEYVYYPTYHHLEGLLAGVAIALTEAFRPALWDRLMKHRVPVFCLGLVILSVAFVVCFRQEPRGVGRALWGFPLFSAAYGCFVIISLSQRRERYSVAAAWLAGLAYPIYLTHKPVIKAVHEAMEKMGYEKFAVTTTAATIGAIVLVASVLHLAIEKPFLALRDKILMNRAARLRGIATKPRFLANGNLE